MTRGTSTAASIAAAPRPESAASPCTTPATRARRCSSALDVLPRVAMAILRHAQISITMEVYTEVPDEVTARNGAG